MADAWCDAGAGLELLPAKSQRHREAKKTPLGFFALKNGRKNRGEFHVFCQWDLKSSRSQNEIESFLKRKSSRFQSVRTPPVRTTKERLGHPIDFARFAILSPTRLHL